MTSVSPPSSESRWSLYMRLVRMDKPIGSLLLLWPTFCALWMASDGLPPPYLLFAFTLGTVLMRSAGCAINDYFDRDIDKHVARTHARVLTTGLIAPREALTVAAVLAALAALLVLPMNGLVWALAVVALLLAVTYPLFKRFFAIPQAYLGIAFGFGIPMAFAAVQESVPPVAWVMLAGNIAWAIAYDTEYAMVDRPDDLKLGLKTSAITFGSWDVALVGVFYLLTLALFALCGVMAGYGLAYYGGVLAAAAIAARHMVWIRGRDRAACFRAFLDNTWFGAALFAGIVLETALAR